MSKEFRIFIKKYNLFPAADLLDAKFLIALSSRQETMNKRLYQLLALEIQIYRGFYQIALTDLAMLFRVHDWQINISKAELSGNVEVSVNQYILSYISVLESILFKVTQ